MTMNSELTSRLHKTWAAQFQVPPALLSTAGTTLAVRGSSDGGSRITIWSLGEHAVVETAPSIAEVVRQALAQFPEERQLTPDDLQDAWGETEHWVMPLYALDATLFHPFPAPPPYTLRQLTTSDQPAFDAFLAQCSEDERADGDVSIDHMIAFGVFDGAEIVTASSVFVWRGFIDTGVLTVPAHRGRGLGKAAISACAEYYLPGEAVVGYRHDATNLASEGIALALGYSRYGVAHYLTVPEQE